MWKKPPPSLLPVPPAFTLQTVKESKLKNESKVRMRMSIRIRIRMGKLTELRARNHIRY